MTVPSDKSTLLNIPSTPNQPSDKADQTPAIKKYELGALDPLKAISAAQLEDIHQEWDNVQENGIITFDRLEQFHENERENKIQNVLKANARRKIERHPSKALIVNKVLENSTKTLKRRSRLNQNRIRKFLKLVRKQKGMADEDEMLLDDMTKEEFELVMALRILEKEDNQRSPRYAHKTNTTLKSTRVSLHKLNKYVNSPKKQQ